MENIIAPRNLYMYVLTTHTYTHRVFEEVCDIRASALQVHVRQPLLLLCGLSLRPPLYMVGCTKYIRTKGSILLGW